MAPAAQRVYLSESLTQREQLRLASEHTDLEVEMPDEGSLTNRDLAPFVTKLLATEVKNTLDYYLNYNINTPTAAILRALYFQFENMNSLPPSNPYYTVGGEPMSGSDSQTSADLAQQARDDTLTKLDAAGDIDSPVDQAREEEQAVESFVDELAAAVVDGYSTALAKQMCGVVADVSQHYTKTALKDRLQEATDRKKVEVTDTRRFDQILEQDLDEVVIVAGDPNQVVNAFDGADPRFFEQVDLPEVLLDRTYRVPEEHWNAATRLLAKAHEIPPVSRDSSGDITGYNSPRFEHSDESGWVRPAPQQTASPADIRADTDPDTLFLTRTQMQADGVGAALETAGYLYRSQADPNGWNTDSADSRLALFNALQKLEPLGPEAFDSGYGLSAYQDADANPERIVLIRTFVILSRRVVTIQACQPLNPPGRSRSAENSHERPYQFDRSRGHPDVRTRKYAQ